MYTATVLVRSWRIECIRKLLILSKRWRTKQSCVAGNNMIYLVLICPCYGRGCRNRSYAWLEAKDIQRSIDDNRQLPMRFRINNVLINIAYSYQTKLGELSDEEALKLVEEAIITGREGVFCIRSSENLTLQQALQTYRKKDSIEKIFNP